MSYFDANSADDVALLHPDVREHDELEAEAAHAELDVIDTYRASDWVTVQLEGWAEDDADAEEPLRQALRRTIADVLSHRLRYLYEDDEATEERRGRIATTRRHGFNVRWPRAWRRRLRPFDLRTPTYVS